MAIKTVQEKDLEHYFDGIDVPTLKEMMFKSTSWFKTLVTQVKRHPVQLKKLIFGDLRNMKNQVRIGKLYIFHYKAKYADTLPIWDEYPLSLVFQFEKNGFYGINLHYVDYKSRAWLLAKLAEASSNVDEKSKVAVSWSILNGFSKFSPDGCTKRYLTSEVQGVFREVPFEDWPKVILLPFQKFHKKVSNKRRKVR